MIEDPPVPLVPKGSTDYLVFLRLMTQLGCACDVDDADVDPA